MDCSRCKAQIDDGAHEVCCARSGFQVVTNAAVEELAQFRAGNRKARAEALRDAHRMFFLQPWNFQSVMSVCDALLRMAEDQEISPPAQLTECQKPD